MRLLALAALLPSLALAQCPDYNSPVNTPTFTAPAKKSFRSFGNRLMAGIYQPWHMVHDEIVKSGTAATMVGKFDYDAVLHKDLEGEYVHVYIAGTGMSSWQYVGRYTTDSDGKIAANLGVRPVGEYKVRMVVEGDLSAVNGYLSVVEPGRKAVLFDIDGTLTISDFEAYADYVGVKTAQAYGYAAQTVNAYKAKGYQIIYLTARPYWVAKDAREWSASQGLLPWHYRSNAYSSGPIPPDTQAHKTNYVKYLRNTVGLDIIRAYGNATTDIAAYADGGIPKAETWIIGENAGKDGTQPIYGDYTYHYSTIVTATPQSSSCL
ncbi:MAG: Phosphatidylinositol transfer protein [Moraxellaceae bacterium]|jgi:phosphatidate phosphatase PAH1|nr:Phosphatidylinositol transfer protein [Moraxellaceae bacterium]